MGCFRCYLFCKDFNLEIGSEENEDVVGRFWVLVLGGVLFFWVLFFGLD